MGKAVADLLSEQDKQIVMEGQEPAAFWVALGGKAPYASDKRYNQKSSYFNSRGQSIISTDFLCVSTRLEKEVAPHDPRLFECSNQTGRFLMTEVGDFTQDDLDEDDVMLLDTWEEVGWLCEVMLSASFACGCGEVVVPFWVMQKKL